MDLEIVENVKHDRFQPVEGQYSVDGFLMYYFYDKEYMKKIADFPLHPSDLLLSTYPRSGTTFTQRIICGLKFGAETIATKDFDLFQKFPHLDLNCFHSSMTYCGYDESLSKQSPRLIKTHVPLSVAPKTIHSTGKVLFVLRNPRDVLVSLYHMNKNDKTLEVDFDFDTFFEMFLEGHVMNGHWCKYNAQWLDFCNRNKDRTHIITYEQLLDNFEGSVSKLAKFLDIQVTDQLISEVKAQTNVSKMKETTVCDGMNDFIRKGVAGDWKKHFSEKQTQQFDEWIAENKQIYPKQLFDLIGE